MGTGIGIDAVPVEKCIEWVEKPHLLTRIFSEQEIAYCFASPRLTAQRLAARFAVREAFFKALHSAGIGCKVPFLTLCKLIEVHHRAGMPSLKVDWKRITASANTYTVSCSFTHIPHVSIACVLISGSTLDEKKTTMLQWT
jgi:holo-[acyl-carrier protein] synthase